MDRKLFRKIEISALTPGQKKAYNFYKLSSALAEYGFATIELNESWQNADFLAQHLDGETCLRVYIKNRLTFHKKYLHRDLYIGFHYENEWYLFPHDKVLHEFLKKRDGAIANSNSWIETGNYSFGRLSKKNQEIIENYKL